MLKMTKIKLELFLDPDIYIFFEKYTKSGISYISIRYSKANKKYLKSYDPKQESKDIIYLHENNSMWLSMSKLFPTSVFKWIDPKESDLNKYSSNNFKECVSEVDLEYPKESHELKNN